MFVGAMEGQTQGQGERLNLAVQQQLNLEQVKTRATSLFKAISRILEDFDAYSRTNTIPKWQDILGQYSMVNLELFNIVDEMKKVSKAFVVHPKNVNAENATILPVMLSSKLLPEMEIDDTSKRDQLLQGLQNLPTATQIDKLKARIDMIAAACEGAEKVLADTRKAYCFGTRQGPAIAPTLDKGQAAKIQEQENLLRAAVNVGLRIPGEGKHGSGISSNNFSTEARLLNSEKASRPARNTSCHPLDSQDPEGRHFQDPISPFFVAYVPVQEI